MMEVKFIYSYKTQLSSHNLRQHFRSVGENIKEGFSLSIQYWPLWREFDLWADPCSEGFVYRWADYSTEMLHTMNQGIMVGQVTTSSKIWSKCINEEVP